MPHPPDLLGPTLQPLLIDTTSAHDLRTTITAARVRLREVLHDRASAAAAIRSWAGPHRERHDADTADLLAAGRVLDDVLGDLLLALEAEVDAATR